MECRWEHCWWARDWAPFFMNGCTAGTRWCWAPTKACTRGWMRGFTSYAEDVITSFTTKRFQLMNIRRHWSAILPTAHQGFPSFIVLKHTAGGYLGYFMLAKAVMKNHHHPCRSFQYTNYAFHQLLPPIQKEKFSWSSSGMWLAAVRDKVLLEYYNQWRFKHPNSNDFVMVVAEKLAV